MRLHIALASAVITIGALELIWPSPARASALFDCPIASCVSSCPEDENGVLAFCQSNGCNTGITNCEPFGLCSGGMIYCGTPPG